MSSCNEPRRVPRQDSLLGMQERLLVTLHNLQSCWVSKSRSKPASESRHPTLFWNPKSTLPGTSHIHCQTSMSWNSTGYSGYGLYVDSENSQRKGIRVTRVQSGLRRFMSRRCAGDYTNNHDNIMLLIPTVGVGRIEASVWIWGMWGMWGNWGWDAIWTSEIWDYFRD
jgi:hypothetical protein